MEIAQIAVLVVISLVNALLPSQWRKWVLFVISLIIIYWLQPSLSIRWLDYTLPSIIIGISVITWWVVASREKKISPITALSREDSTSLVIILAIILLLTIPRYFDFPIALTSRPPEIWQVITIIIALIIILPLGSYLISFRWTAILLLLIILAFLIIIKSEVLSIHLSVFLRQQTGQDTGIASVIDIQWLGFSYVAFRLIHTIRDWQTGILPDLSLREFITYVIFFPAFTAGPIDRVERFLNDFRAIEKYNPFEANRFTEAAARICIGLFKKFFIADSLAIISLSHTSIDQALSAPALWLMLYAYALRLFFDFSGYTDIAIGIGILWGIQLPENFNRPYLKNTITTFWQSWHMTLSSWVRTYVYSPLSRQLLRSRYKNHVNIILLISTLATMLTIGIWHGITLPFIVWGLWHGIGLFIHKVWSDHTRAWLRRLRQHPGRDAAWRWTGVILTFHFVVLGWVWFVSSDLSSAFRLFLALFGVAP
ncbi:MAG: MBOAT family protein [Anaerolineae bacterium]|nr:MBOAT family protein [Anaerolineae bacterium]MBN8617267.1 MBOAT family protein [Anaerolineae bacterium]